MPDLAGHVIVADKDSVLLLFSSCLSTDVLCTRHHEILCVCLSALEAHPEDLTSPLSSQGALQLVPNSRSSFDCYACCGVLICSAAYGRHVSPRHALPSVSVLGYRRPTKDYMYRMRPRDSCSRALVHHIRSQ